MTNNSNSSNRGNFLDVIHQAVRVIKELFDPELKDIKDNIKEVKGEVKGEIKEIK